MWDGRTRERENPLLFPVEDVEGTHEEKRKHRKRRRDLTQPPGRAGKGLIVFLRLLLFIPSCLLFDMLNLYFFPIRPIMYYSRCKVLAMLTVRRVQLIYSLAFSFLSLFRVLALCYKLTFSPFLTSCVCVCRAQMVEGKRRGLLMGNCVCVEKHVA